ncbi:nucleotidyltransferase family protein [Nocardioides sp. NPDC101246]|uniref:nucleotidyltransferase family protein n=1 Tax=Nocardioides sp. NPDC101246 TaxID=3364336 RepID=UPI0038085C1E
MSRHSQRLHVPRADREERLRALLLADAEVRSVVQAAVDLDVPSWAVGGGVVRNVVWDFIFESRGRTAHNDIDLVYFDIDLTESKELQIEKSIHERCGNASAEVRNQARVHLWYERRFGHRIDPVTDIEDAVARFPETCTSVAITGTSIDALDLLAPCGLDDLFEGVLRRNPQQVTAEYFEERLTAKRIDERWPGVTVVRE